MMTDSKPQDHRVSIGPVHAAKFQGDMKAMHAALRTVKYWDVNNAGNAYKGASVRLQAVAEDLHRLASDLGSVWQGEDAETAIKQLKRLQTTAQNLSAATQQAGASIGEVGHHLEQAVNNAPGAGLIEGWDFNPTKDVEQEATDDHMAELARLTAESSQKMPLEVTTDIPGAGEQVFGVDEPFRTGGGGGGGGGGTGGPGMPNYPSGGPPSAPSLPKDPFGGPTNPGPGSALPKDPFGSNPGGSDLAGIPGGSGGGGMGADPFGRGGLGVGTGGGAGGFGGGAGAGGLGSAPLGAGGLTGGAGGVGRGGSSAGRGLGAGAGAGARGGGGMMGGGAPGGGGGKGEEEHERSTWLVEDEDVWGASDGDAAPPVIG